MAVTPRVRPRVPLEDLVDRETHPPRRKIGTAPDAERPRLHWTQIVALIALLVFWSTLPVAGFLIHPALGFVGLAVSSLVVAYFMGAD